MTIHLIKDILLVIPVHMEQNVPQPEISAYNRKTCILQKFQ